MVCFAENDGINLTCVVLNASSSVNRFQDGKNLIEYGYNNFSNQVLVQKGESITTIEVSNATKDSKDIELITEENLTKFLPNDYDINDLEYEITLNENISAPISSGTELGTVTYTVEGTEYSIALISKTSAYKAHNYSIYILLIGLVLLIISIIIIPKKKDNQIL